MRYQTGYINGINYRKKTSLPVRDFMNDGKIVFIVDIYGWTGKDVCTIGVGSNAPIEAAVKRLGLDPTRYAGSIWDAQI